MNLLGTIYSTGLIIYMIVISSYLIVKTSKVLITAVQKRRKK